MKQILFAALALAAFNIQASPSTDAAMAIESGAAPGLSEPTRRQISGQELLEVDTYSIPDLGVRVSVPAGETHDTYPATVVEDYPTKTE